MNPQFISNDPRGEDLFGEKAQERIAASIAVQIRDQPLHSKLIGLEGSWGAGKSNVIKLIENRLSATHHVYVHDAWGHQEDLQRRAFLEELTEDLYLKEVLAKDVWKKKLDDLLSRKHETVTKSVPKLSTGIVVTILLAFFTPVTASLAKQFSEHWYKYPVLLAPVLVPLSIWLVICMFSWKRPRITDLFYLYKEKETEDRKETITSEREPSVRLFKQWMKELSDDLGTGEKKLIVVFDNMDRLPPDKVKILWSSINTFFSDFSFDHISVIIPFDAAHILAAFGNSDDVAGQFISKTFRVIFRVAQPVLTDWQAFFTLKFENAFGSGFGSELIVLKTIFDLATPSITPRDIIAFINEMVSVSLVLGDEVGLRYIGLFCLNKKEILADPARIIEELPFIERFKTVFRDDDQIQDSLAAIAYNVPKESARQIILKREIQLAIREENQERFEGLTGQKHFSDMLEQISMIDELPITAFIHLCGGLPENPEKLSAAESTEFWDRLNSYFMKAPQNTQEFTTANRILMDRCSVEHKLQHASYFAQRMNSMDNFLGDKYYHSLNKFDEFSRDGGLGIRIHDHLLDKDMEAEDFVLFVTAGGGLEPDFKVSTNVDKLNEYLIDAVGKGRKVDPIIGEIQESYDLKATVEYLTAQMVAVDNKITYDNLINVVDLLDALTPDSLLPRLPDTVLKLFLEHTDQKEETFLELVAMRLSRGNSYAYEGIAVESFLEVSVDDDSDFVAQVAKRFEKYGNYGTGLLFAGKWKNNLLTGVMQDVTVNHYGTSRMNVAEVLSRFTEIATAFALDLEIFIDRLNAWSRFLSDNINKETIRAKVGDVGFYRQAVNSKNKLTRFMIKTYKDSLQEISEEAWMEVFTNKDTTLINVLTFIEGGRLRSLPVNGVLAFKKLISDFAAGDYNDISEADFLILKKSISDARLKTVLKNIRDRFLTDLMMTTRHSLFFFKMFIDNADMSERPGDAVRRLFIPMLSHSESLGLLLLYSEDVISIVLAGGVEGLSFVEGLKALDSEDPKTNHIIERLKLSDAESKITKVNRSKKKQKET